MRGAGESEVVICPVYFDMGVFEHQEELANPCISVIYIFLVKNDT